MSIHCFFYQSVSSAFLALAGLLFGGDGAQAGTSPRVLASASPLSPRVGLLDSRRPDAPRLVMGQPQPEGEPRHYLRLAPSMGKKLECCVRAGAAAQETSILQYHDEDMVPADERDATFQKAPEEGFVALLLPKNSVVLRTSARQVVLQLPGHHVRVRVDHCLSSEGMHLKIAESDAKGQWMPKAHYYLPLETDVMPDCSS